MVDFEVIDVHTHLARSMAEEEYRMAIPGRRRRDRWATPETALSFMDWEGISKAIVLYLPPLPPSDLKMEIERMKLSQLPAVKHEKLKPLTFQIGQLLRQFNQWGCDVGQKFPRLVTFICIAPDLGNGEKVVEELILGVKHGAKGVKLHPGLFHFSPADKRLWPMYKKCEELNLPVLADSAPSPGFRIQSGWRLSLPKMGIEYGEPERFAEVLEYFPRLTLILAHLGSAWWDERVELAMKYPNVYFDTSQGFLSPDQIPCNPRRGLAEEDAVRIIRKIGVERILFGSDGPAHERLPQLEQLLRLPLNRKEKQLILSENTRRILHI
jgi:predicted TIM-barrel fold metal-dependent hydrolase